MPCMSAFWSLRQPIRIAFELQSNGLNVCMFVKQSGLIQNRVSLLTETNGSGPAS